MTNKKEELKEKLLIEKRKIQEQEDELNNDLSDLKAKVKSIETKKRDLFAEESNARKEMEEIRKQKTGMYINKFENGFYTERT